MINTSTLYKRLFVEGAVQEYKIDINGVSYYSKDIYDKPSITQRLFDKPTYTVGSFAVSVLKMKLKIASTVIPRNSKIVFSYRYTNGEEQSEWVAKFEGKITNRTVFAPEITTIEAHDQGTNYDLFLDTFPTQVPAYPANARTIAKLCASHLGVVIDNETVIYNGDVVEFPSDLTVVQVLQNIAALSGGNWTITENNTLRLVVVKGYNIVGDYKARSKESSPKIAPISRVTMFWSDDKAFTAGDDTGTEVIVDCLWATPTVTQYVYNLLKGFEYIPSKSKTVYLDPAVQLGDSFTCDGETQLVGNIDWTFDGSCVASVEAPQSSEGTFDDPYGAMIKNQFKRKVSLGDSYQGVTIDRENGLQMLYSPDGTEENATGKFYTDLEKGMAMQYRESSTDPWKDWLYFDKNEQIFKLSLYGTTEETNNQINAGLNPIIIQITQIEQTIESLELSVERTNILPNSNGMNGLDDWSFISMPLIAKGTTPYVTARATNPQPAIDQNKPIMSVVTTDTSGKSGFEIFQSGSIYTKKIEISAEKELKLQLLAKGSGNVTYKLKHFKNDTKLSEIELFKIVQSSTWVQYSKEWEIPIGTNFIEIEIVSLVDAYSNTSAWTTIANQKLTQDRDIYTVADTDTYEYAKSNITILDSKILLNSEYINTLQNTQTQVGITLDAMKGTIESKVDVNGVISSINLSKEGVTIDGKNLNLNGTITANGNVTISTDGKIKAINAEFVDAKITGSISAGSVGDWSIVSGLISSKTKLIELDAVKEEIRFGNNILKHVSNNVYNILRLTPKDVRKIQFSIVNSNLYQPSELSVSGQNGTKEILITTDTYSVVGSGIAMLGIGGSNPSIGAAYGIMSNTNEFKNSDVYVVADTLAVKKIFINGTLYRLTRDASGYLMAVI